MTKKKNEFLAVLFLTLIVFISVVALTLTNEITKDKIKIANKEAITEMLATLFPEMEDFNYDESSGLYTPLAGGEPIGHAFMTEGAGYGGVISILIGIKPDETLRGIKVISHQETPGLGAKITEPFFLDQFQGISAEQVALARNGGKIDAITGATISSTAVVNAVKGAVLKKMDDLNKEVEGN